MRIKETRVAGAGGFDTGAREVRVYDIADDHPLPPNAQEMPKDTPLSDWTADVPTPKEGK